MEKFKQKLQIFMMGRYGIDDFYKFLCAFYLILIVVNIFARSLGVHIAIWILLVYSVYRILSKNIAARQKENATYLIVKNKVIKFFKSIKTRLKDKDHLYRKCPHCKATLRFPRKKGKHNAICPKCKKELKVIVRF